MFFIGIATNFDNIHSNHFYQLVFDIFGFVNDVNFAIFGTLLIGFYIFRDGVNLLNVYSMVGFSKNLYAQITKII